MGFGEWHRGYGTRYEVRMDHDVLWYDRNQYHGRTTVEIRDRETGETLQRVGDIRVIGNFSPVFVNVEGRRIQVEKILTFDKPFAHELEELDRQEWMRKHGLTEITPHDWIPPRKKKGR